MEYKIGANRFQEVKSRLRQESISEFFRKDTIIWLIAAIIIYFIQDNDLIYAAFFYVGLLFFNSIGKVLSLNAKTRNVIKHHSLIIYGHHIILRRNYASQKADLSNCNVRIDKHQNIIVTNINRSFWNSLFGLEKITIPPEINGYQDIKNILRL